MATWGQFAKSRPDLADAGRALLYQHGVGLSFLATVRSDGGPRVHPMCPILANEHLFAFIIPSPKQEDLRRDGRFALHSFPRLDNEDAFYLSGRVRLVEDQTLRQLVGEQFVSERERFNVPPPGTEDLLVEFEISHCLFTTTSGHGDPTPSHTVWLEE